MKIIRLEAENVKRLRAVSITPQGNIIQITGRNGQGKTSLLDAIWWALAGQSAIQGEPIRGGEHRARIRLDLGEIIVTRTFKRQEDGVVTTAITVENTEGIRFGSPQKMLDALLGELTFDPLEFARMQPRAQFETLRRFVPGVDFDALDAAQKTDYERRTTYNRQAKEARAQASGLRIPPEAATSLQDESAIAAEMVEGAKLNSEITRLEAVVARADEMRTEAARLEREAKKLLKTVPEVMPSRVDLQALEPKLKAAHEANAEAEAFRSAVQTRKELTERADDLEKQSRQLTDAMELRGIRKREAIAAAKMPVPGLDFGEGLVLKDGVPFEQASDAEKLRTSVAIAMAMNPKLRVVRIRDGSLLDTESLALVGQMADDHDCQVWIERVADDRKVGIVIEDGAVVPNEEVAR